MLIAKHKNLLSRLAQLVIPQEGLQQVPPEDILANIDHYLAGIRTPTGKRLRQVLDSLIDLPLSRGMLEHLISSESPLRDLIIPAFQIIYLGFYGDPRSYPLVGYRPFEDRHPERLSGDSPAVPAIPVQTPDSVIETDVCVIGSGAAGAVIAYVLGKEQGREVLIVEKGSYLSPESFTNRELDMVSRLYLEGGLQLTLDFGMHILQGSCVGGSTLVNNAICFRLDEVPEGDHILDNWKSRGANLDPVALWKSYTEVAKVICPVEIPEDRINLGAKLLFQGFDAWKNQGGQNLRHGKFLVNFQECLGAGYCNIGCKYNRKLSTLVTYLPLAAESGRVKILPDCKALQVIHDGHQAREVRCQWSGDEKPGSIRIKAKTIVVSAGTIASSSLLLRSGIINPRIGQAISFNAGGLIHAEFDQNDYPNGVNSFDGVQMCNYIRGPEGQFYIESIFNPPMSHALSVPGWFEEHFANMRRFPFFATAGVIVGTAPAGKLLPDLLLGGYRVNFDIDHGDGQDWQRLLAGLRLASEFFLAAHAKRVLPAASIPLEIKKKADLPKIQALKPRELYHGSSHPQGGNAMSDKPGEGVVNSSFQVMNWEGKAIENLFVCDASIFPTSIGINPQWTIMAIADYGARTGRIK
jgi:choline dehydrogenase-like flavoprotein